MRSSKRPHRSRARLARWSILLAVALLALASPAAAATWTAVSSPNLTQFSNVLWGADALSSSSAWAVGRAETGTLPIHRPVIERWNGSSWRISASPLPPGGGELRDVDATSASHAWAVGFSSSSNGNLTLTERWNGSAWTRESTPATGTVWDAAAAGPGTVWAVGQRGNPNTGVGRTFTLRTSNG